MDIIDIMRDTINGAGQSYPDDTPEVPGSACHYDGVCELCGAEVDNGGDCTCPCHSYV